MDVIAEREFRAKFADGGTSVVTIRVSRPFPHLDAAYGCTVQVEGLQTWQRSTDTYGVDSWQAPMLGLNYLRFILSREVKFGTVFHWADDPEPVKVEELFKVHDVE